MGARVPRGAIHRGHRRPGEQPSQPGTVRRLADLLDASVVLADHEPASLAAACPSWRLLHAAHLKATAGKSPGTDGSLVQPGERPAVVSFASGTTGTPKGVVLTHQALADAATVFADVIGTGQGASTLVIAPLFHNTGFVDQLGHMLVVGGRTDLLRRFHASEAIAATRERPTTFVTAVPSVLRLLMINNGAEAVFSPATDVLFGGSPMPPAWTRELATRWPHLRLHHGYGLTEFTSAVSFLPPELAGAHGESVGTPAPGVSVRLVGDTGHDMPPGEVGEVWASGPTRMREYWNLPAATGAAIRDGWLRTGDLARCHGGLLYLCGRTDDVINRGGEDPSCGCRNRNRRVARRRAGLRLRRPGPRSAAAGRGGDRATPGRGVRHGTRPHRPRGPSGRLRHSRRLLCRR